MGVIGLGYVGLAVASVLAEAGFRVVGVDRKADRIAKIDRGECPIDGDEPGLAELLAEVITSQKLVATTDHGRLAEADVVIVSVETPVTNDHEARFDALRGACADLAQVLKHGALVIVESTVAPGTCDRVVRPLLEAGGKRLNEEFYLGHCPERVMPGRLLKNIRELARVCGGATPETSRAMVALYRTIVEAKLDESDLVTAELVKTAENAYRDVNIAFANELALVCEAAGADFRRVRELVNESPGRAVLLAGAGVGGHCIPKDSWLLVHGLVGFTPRVIAAAREVNDAMPRHMARLVEGALSEHGKSVRGTLIAVLGYAYLEDSGDTRNTPSDALVFELRARGADVVIHDPWVPEYRNDLWAVIAGADAVVIMVAHSAYRGLDLERVRTTLRTPVLVDGRHLVETEAAAASGLTFRGLGRVCR